LEDAELSSPKAYTFLLPHFFQEQRFIYRTYILLFNPHDKSISKGLSLVIPRPKTSNEYPPKPFS